MTKHDTIQHDTPGEIARSQALFEAIDSLTKPVLDRALDKLHLAPAAREHFFQEIADCSKVIGKITCARVVKITTDRSGMVFVTVTDGTTTFILGPSAFSPAQIDELKRAVNEAMDSGKPTLINAVIDPAAGSESGRIGNLNPQSVLKKK